MQNFLNYVEFLLSPTCFEPRAFILRDRFIYAVWYVLLASVRTFWWLGECVPEISHTHTRTHSPTHQTAHTDECKHTILHIQLSPWGWTHEVRKVQRQQKLKLISKCVHFFGFSLLFWCASRLHGQQFTQIILPEYTNEISSLDIITLLHMKKKSYIQNEAWNEPAHFGKSIVVRDDVTYLRVTRYSFTKNTMVFEQLATCGVAENNKVRHLEVVWVRSENHSQWRSIENIWCHL